MTQEEKAKQNGKEPIYPEPMRGAEQGFGNQYPHDLSIGLTKREYFAGLAMQGILANPKIVYSIDWIAKHSLLQADELLKQLEQ